MQHNDLEIKKLGRLHCYQCHSQLKKRHLLAHSSHVCTLVSTAIFFYQHILQSFQRRSNNLPISTYFCMEFPPLCDFQLKAVVAQCTHNPIILEMHFLVSNIFVCYLCVEFVKVIYSLQTRQDSPSRRLLSSPRLQSLPRFHFTSPRSPQCTTYVTLMDF